MLTASKNVLRHNANIETQAKFMAVACFGMMELSFKFTPLFIAASKGHLNVVRCLAESEADINSTRSNDNSSALMMASLNGHLDVVNFLLEKGANIDHQNSDGETALHYAVAGDSSDVVHTLMSRGASQLYNSNGMTPLLDSCNGCSISVAEVLLTRPELTKQQRIDSLELLGASLATGYSISVLEARYEGKVPSFRRPIETPVKTTSGVHGTLPEQKGKSKA